MKKLLVLLFLIPILSFSQTCTTTVVYDRMETYTWFGDWFTPAVTTGFFTNASTSPTTSGVLYGLGAGTSAYELDWYSLPNQTGLNTAFNYQLKFRLGSYRFTNTTATTRGVDIGDFIEVQISTNGGVTYTSEIRVTGNNNAFWNYNTLGTITKTSNGVLTTYSPAGGGDRSATGDGYSVITLNLPPSITQIAVDIYCRANSAGEEWWLDDIELIEISPCSPLPIELVEFNGVNYYDHNLLTWVSATEINNHFYTLERSVDAFNWSEITYVDGAGTSSTPILYSYKDYTYIKEVTNYYRLKQTDFNGNFEYFKIIDVTYTPRKKPILIKIVNYMGQEVNENETGFLIEIYDDGSTRKIYRQ